MEKLEGGVVAVTGANRGIGLAIAHALSREGARLILIGRNRPAIARAAKAVGNGALAMAADVTNPADLGRTFRAIRNHFGRLDVLVNNAGVFTYKPFARTTLNEWHANIDSNLTSLFVVTQAALPLLKKSSNGHVVNILSIASRKGFAKCSAYCASKFGALGLTKVLREELRSEGIRVTAILPGTADTRMAGEFDFPVDRAKLIQPADIAEAVVAALIQPARTTVEEILLMPSAGRL